MAARLAEHPRSEVNALDGRGRSALQVAVELGRHPELGVLLAEPRVNLNLATGCDGDTALTLAFKLGRRDMVKALLGQPRLRANTRNWDTTNSSKTMVHYLWDLMSLMRSEDHGHGRSDDHDFYLDCTELLMGRGDVQRYLQALAADMRMFHNSTTAFLVGAAVVAAATFAGFLHPPLGGLQTWSTTTGTAAGPVDRLLKYSSTKLSSRSVKVFWASNSVAFFFAIFTVVSAIQSVLPKAGPRRRRFLEDDVFRLRLKLGVTSFTLMVSAASASAAFIAAGFGNLPSHTLHRTMVAATVFGLLLLVPFIFIPLLFDYHSYLGDYSSADVQKLASLSDRLFTSAPFLSVLLVTALTFGAVLILIIESVL